MTTTTLTAAKFQELAIEALAVKAQKDAADRRLRAIRKVFETEADKRTDDTEIVVDAPGVHFVLTACTEKRVVVDAAETFAAVAARLGDDKAWDLVHFVLAELSKVVEDDVFEALVETTGAGPRRMLVKPAVALKEVA